MHQARLPPVEDAYKKTKLQENMRFMIKNFIIDHQIFVTNCVYDGQNFIKTILVTNYLVPNKASLTIWDRKVRHKF